VEEEDEDEQDEEEDLEVDEEEQEEEQSDVEMEDAEEEGEGDEDEEEDEDAEERSKRRARRKKRTERVERERRSKRRRSAHDVDRRKKKRSDRERERETRKRKVKRSEREEREGRRHNRRTGKKRRPKQSESEEESEEEESVDESKLAPGTVIIKNGVSRMIGSLVVKPPQPPAPGQAGNPLLVPNLPTQWAASLAAQSSVKGYKGKGKGPGGKSAPLVKWKVSYDGNVNVRKSERLDSDSAEFGSLVKGDIVEQVGKEVRIETTQGVVVRMPITHPRAEKYPEPIGWVTRTAKDCDGPEFFEECQQANPAAAKGVKGKGKDAVAAGGGGKWGAPTYAPPTYPPPSYKGYQPTYKGYYQPTWKGDTSWKGADTSWKGAVDTSWKGTGKAAKGNKWNAYAQGNLTWTPGQKKEGETPEGKTSTASAPNVDGVKTEAAPAAAAAPKTAEAPTESQTDAEKVSVAE